MRIIVGRCVLCNYISLGREWKEEGCLCSCPESQSYCTVPGGEKTSGVDSHEHVHGMMKRFKHGGR